MQEQLIQIFRDWGRGLNSAERQALEKKATGYNINDWKGEHVAMAVASGAASGAIGGPVGLAAIMPDLLWCKKVGIQGCLGIGHLRGCEVDYEQDMNYIMAVWTQLADPSSFVPSDKIAIKVCSKVSAKTAVKVVAGKVVSKAALKGGSKMAAKLAAKAASKAAGKVAAKLAAKTGIGWVPVIGGVVSGGINWWLVSGLLDAADQYYTHDYIILRDKELASAV